MSVLLCLQFFPEEVKFYTINPTADEIELLKRAHGKFINMDELNAKEEKAVMYVLAAASEHKEGWDGVPKSVIGKWAGNKIDDRRPPKIRGRLVITGMMV